MKYNVLNLINGTFPNTDINENINILETQLEYDKYINICLSLFKWENLPNGINPIFLEKTLIDNGKGMFINDSELGFMFVPCVASDKLNYQNEPISYSANANGYSKTFLKDEIVLIRNNPLEIPSSQMILNYCLKIAECSNISRINLQAQKTPILVICDDKDLLTMKNLYNDYKGNIPVIFGDKNLNFENLKVLKTDAPFVIDKISDYKIILKNELLTNLGIDNTNIDKKERLITDEVNSNNKEIEINRNVMLNERKKACELINKKFNLNINVSINVNNEVEEVIESE